MTSYPLPVTCETASAKGSVASPTGCGILCKTVIGVRGFAKSHRLSSSSSSSTITVVIIIIVIATTQPPHSSESSQFVVRSHALYWEVPDLKRGPGRPRTNWSQEGSTKNGTYVEDCEETETADLNRQECYRSVVQRVRMDAG